MKLYNNQHIILILLFLPIFLLSGILTSCGLIMDRDLDCPDEQSDDISVSFRITTGKPAKTKAIDDYGTDDENYIDINNLKILIFDENQTLKQVLYDNGVLDSKTKLIDRGEGTYLLRTRLDPTRYDRSSEFAIVVLANWCEIKETSGWKLNSNWKGKKINFSEIGALKIDDLKAMIFTLNPVGNDQIMNEQQPSWVPGDDNLWVPMFGSSYAKLADYQDTNNEDNPMVIADINLVRAFSKIKIVNNDTAEGSPEIESITFSPRNLSGYLIQEEYDFSGTTSNVNSPTIGSATERTDTEVPFYNEGNTYTVYIPEMNFNTQEDRKAICVNIDINGTKQSKYIYLTPYSDGQPILKDSYEDDQDWNAIKRNYTYEYTINSLAFGLKIEVSPWKFGGKVHIDFQ